MSILSIEEIAEALGTDTNWEISGDKLIGTFIFSGFSEAMQFVNEIAQLAEAQNHHPEILIDYDKVTLRLWTHSEGGVTDKDVAFAKKADFLKAKT